MTADRCGLTILTETEQDRKLDIHLCNTLDCILTVHRRLEDTYRIYSRISQADPPNHTFNKKTSKMVNPS